MPPAVRRHSIFYLSADLQNSQMFKPRKPLSKLARRELQMALVGCCHDCDPLARNA
jgi:hypothetical protein